MSSGVVYLNEKGDFTNAAIQKLGELEDIEEELGIDLVTLLKAVKNGIFCKQPDGYIDYYPFRIGYWVDFMSHKKGMLVCGMNIEDYGKTWALTKEELK